MRFRTLCERFRVRFQRTHPQVERTLRLDIFVAEIRQALAKQLAILGVRRHVARLVHASLDHTLEEHRRAHKPERTPRTAHRRIHRARIGGRRGHKNPSNALAWQGQGLGVRIAHDGVLIDARNPRHVNACIGNLSIRLIADQIKRRTVLLAARAQKRRQRFQAFARVHRAHRIVRRVDHDRTRALRDGRTQCIDVRLEVGFARRNFHAPRTCRLNPDFVLREIRGDDDDLVPFRQHQRMERDVE